MIIKSMSRKHASFSQLIDYIEAESKLKSRRFSIFHNTYGRDSEHIKNEFSENAQHLKFRKNGVYLYHEIISITRTKNIAEEEQKAILQEIVQKYLNNRSKNNLAYAVLHEDKKDNLHFHIVISANEVGETTRKRLSKSEFANIQSDLEQWVLTTHPEIEQQAVFFRNQTDQEREAREQKTRLSNKGAELKRRAGNTSHRDHIKDTLSGIFENASDGRHFSDLLEKDGLRIYQRGKQYGVTDKDGTKYRFSRLGLAEEWEALDKRMMESLQRPNTKDQQKTEQASPTEPQQQAEYATTDTVEAETQKRLKEVETMRKTRANPQNKNSIKHRER